MKPLAPPPDWIAPYEPDPDPAPSRVAHWLGVVVDGREVVDRETWLRARAGSLDAQNFLLAAIGEARFQTWREALEREAEERFGPRGG
jgi:hypothetical protein